MNSVWRHATKRASHVTLSYKWLSHTIQAVSCLLLCATFLKLSKRKIYIRITYADDTVLLAWKALQQLVSVLVKHIADIDMNFNVKKTVCMILNWWYYAGLCVKQADVTVH